MNEMILGRLAKRLLKCPFHLQLFDSPLCLRLHLVECHADEIREQRCVLNPAVLQERPAKLLFCGHCSGFPVADSPDGTAITAIERHIRADHPNRFGPVQLKISVSTDVTLIDQFAEQQASHEVCTCLFLDCQQIFSDEASAALHWVEEHCRAPTVEETRHALEIDPDYFRNSLAALFEETEKENAQNRLLVSEPDDGYVVRHTPNVPRVRSKPGEYVIFVEHEPVRLLDREVEELLEREGFDGDEGALAGGTWAKENNQTVRIELRFCNILDGYIPLVKDLRRILPPMADGGSIEMVLQDEPNVLFPCKVSRSKRAIYNLEKRLQRFFWPFPSGLRLSITRIGQIRYRLEVRRQPHTVRNCKHFVSDGNGGWTVQIHDEVVEWDTGDDVFRHQLTFQQMDALHAEARRSNVSVRDAVYDVMRRFASDRPLHVGSVHDAVFLRMRTCSVAAVWAQFRPEHKCYARIQPGWYQFEPTEPLPVIRVIPLPPPPRERLQQYSRDGERYRVKQRTWRHNIYDSRLEHYRHVVGACLEVRCAFGTPDEVVFVIPIPYLMADIIPRANCNDRGQYLFSVNRHDLVFTWDHGVRMEGRPFLTDNAQ